MKKIFSNMKPARMAMMFILAMLTTLTVQAAADKTALAAASRSPHAQACILIMV
jgi:hypothetical protein